MKSKKAIPVIMAMCLIMLSHRSFAQTAEELLPKAIQLEEVKGDLDGAIKTYQLIINKFPDNRDICAKALLRLGMCHEKLGDREAVKAYNRLVKNYPEQKSEVAVARERLSILIPVAEKLSAAPLVPEFTKIKMPGNPGNGMLSPDGKKIAFISEGDIWVVPVSGGVNPFITGEPKRLTNDIGAWDMNNSFCWSGNGKWIAFNAERGKISSTTSIYVIPSEGGEAQKVQVPSHLCGWPGEFRLSLSPDGKTLAYVSGWKDYNNKSGQIFTIPVNGDEAKELTEPGTLDPAWSPDGSMIAYVKFTGSYGKDEYSEIFVIPAGGGDPKLLVNRQSGQFSGPVWSPDGKMIAFNYWPHSGIDTEIWLVRVINESNSLGTLRKVDPPLESYHTIAGWTPDNKIGLQLTNLPYETIYTVPSKGGIATQVTPQGWTSYPKWSPDGKRIYFRWDGGKIASVPSGGGAVDSLQIDSEFNIITAVPGSGNDISPDGKTIVFSGAKYFNDKGERQWEVDIFTIPVGGGKPKQLTSISNKFQDRFPCWSPDGNSIAFIRPEIVDTKFYMHIYTMSGEGENLRKITERSDDVAYAPIDWTPDGRAITFFTNRNSICSIPLEGGQPTLITKVDSVNSQYELAWSPDGKDLAYTDKGKIWIFNPGSGITREVKTGVEANATKIGWSPDGKKIAFTVFAGGDADLWLMKNFLPLDKLPQEPVTETAEESQGIKVRQVWKSPLLDDLGAVSYDGRFRSYVDWGIGNVGIHNLLTDEKRVLTDDANLGESWQFADNTVISKDGKRIVYSWLNPYNTTALRLIEVDNPEPELLYRKTGEELYPSVWLSDNVIVAFRFIPNNRIVQLVTFNIPDKTIWVKKTLPSGQFRRLACSLDEKYIAYDLRSDTDKGTTDIHLLEANGEEDIPLITHPSNDRVLGWVPGRKEFLFISDRSGTWDLWAIKLDGTKPAGQPKRIYADIGDVEPLGFTSDGKCYFGFVRRNFYSGLAPFNAETGEINLESGQSLKSQNFGIKWSPDGQYLAYIKIEDRNSDNPVKLLVQDVKTGKEYQPDNNKHLVASYSWSPDGNSIIFRGREVSKLQEEGYKGGVFMLDVKTGRTDKIFLLTDYEYNGPEDDSDPLSRLVWAKDGKSFYFLFQKDRLVKHDLETGEEKVLYKYPDFMPDILEVSPDGKNLLFGLRYPGDKKSRLVTLPVEGGKEETVCTSQETRSIGWAKYSHDGKYIYFMELPETIKSVLWRVPAQGGDPEKLWSPENRVEIYDIHPDGNQVAYSIQERVTEVRVIENLIQELERLDKID